MQWQRKIYEIFDDMEDIMTNKITEINNQAALITAGNLTRFLGKHVTVDMSKASLKKMINIGDTFDPEEIVAGVYLPVTGAINGSSLFILPKESAFIMSDILLKRKLGTTRKLTKIDESALKETGNIISGCYLSTLSNTYKIKLIEHIPQFSFDMFGAILSQIISKFAKKADEALFIEIRYNIHPVKIAAYYLLLFDSSDIQLILEKQ